MLGATAEGCQSANEGSLTCRGRLAAFCGLDLLLIISMCAVGRASITASSAGCRRALIYAYRAAALHGAAWPGTAPQAMPAGNLSPAVVAQPMRLHQRPESSCQATVTATATQVTVTAVGGLSAAGQLTDTTGIADANIELL